jgi:large subunit ribosomal protein L10
MTKEQKNEVIEALKEKFSQYNNFYVTNTEALSVDQVSKLPVFVSAKMLK